MAKKIVSYKLTEEGFVPDFIEDGGYFAKDANDTPNMVCLGITKDDADTSGAVQEFANESDVIVYVSTYISDTTTTDPITGQERVFIVADAVKDLFDKLV
jgi:hypothetical protein